MKIRWPWVRRTKLDQAVAINATLTGDLARARAMIAELERDVFAAESESRRLSNDVLESQMLILDRMSKVLAGQGFSEDRIR